MEASSHSFRLTRRASESGVALVMTLITLSILTILLIAFVSSMSLERQAANAYEETQRAKLVAQGAVSHAIDLLRANIPDPALLSATPGVPGKNWVINPGRLTILKGNTAPKYIPLHTGEVTSAPAAGQPRDAESVDLNEPPPGETIPAITGTAAGVGANRPPMRVRWFNLLQDPSADPSPGNRLVGRYAFWIDDECARVNFNTALGKPAPTVGTMFGDQLAKGFVTPLFERGDSTILYGSGSQRSWALGRPQSINLDAFFDSPSQLLADKLLAHAFLRGFARYPQAIMDFVDVPSPQTWYDQHRYDLTFYSRSPEFNTFGKSRFFTTYVPLSLEAGPTYQHPFIFDPSGAFSGEANSSEILHLNSLFGTFGFGNSVVDDDGVATAGGNVVNRMQVEMIFDYLRRAWPGFGNASFLTKYGEAECRQIALNAVLMARMATTQHGDDLEAFSRDWGYRTTSVNYAPDSGERAGQTPERFYWRPPHTPKLMLPQTPGPHITEVRLVAKAIPASKKVTNKPDEPSAPPNNNASKLSTFASPVYLQYRYEVEYYMHPLGPVVDLAAFPTQMDYLELTAEGPQANGKTLTRSQLFNVTNWNAKNNLARLVALPNVGTKIGPSGAQHAGVAVPNRQVVSSPWFTVGASPKVVPRIAGTDYSDWDPQPYDAAKAATASLSIQFRPGMGIVNKDTGLPTGRPRQMIPLGETAADTLQAEFTVSIQPANRELAYSWQINDPRLSWDLVQWNQYKQGPDEPAKIGSPGVENITADALPIEPWDNASERSKFRYIQRAPDGAKIDNYALDRGDEYDTAGRTASPGYWSVLHTGIQSGVPWRTLDFGPASGQTSPPDWLLLDLLGPTYPMAHDQWKIDSTLPDQFSTASYMNSTAGQVNLNSRIYPQTAFFQAPARTQPLAAVFKNLRSDSDVATLVDNIGAYQTDSEVFEYVGELANVPGYGGTGTKQWEKESLLRNMAGVLTTRSNTFGVWGVAQVVKKRPGNVQHDVFEKGDVVRGEKRFYALVERYVWPGRDGVPGNAHTSATGTWDRLAKQRAPITLTNGITDTLFQLPGSPPLFRPGSQTRLQLDANPDNPGTYPAFDGPERVGMNKYSEAALGKIEWTKSTLEDAYNPPQAAIKYRVVYFKYLDQ